MKPIALVLSCEHASNYLPAAYAQLFADNIGVLNTHRSYDLKAFEVASYLSKILSCECTMAEVTRLLIDCNRSLKHPHCFSEFTLSLPAAEKEQIAALFYRPYRARVQARVQQLCLQGSQVLHFSVHSFTPMLAGVTRNADVGILYDPNRHGEKEVARVLRSLMMHKLSDYRIRTNYPYVGKSDSLTATLRKIYHETDYLGFEIECNQALIADEVELLRYQGHLASSILELIEII